MEYKVTHQICKTYVFKFPINNIPYQAIINNSKMLQVFLSENNYALKSLILSNDMNDGKVEFEIEKKWLEKNNEEEMKIKLLNILREYFNLPSLTFKSFNVDYVEKIPSLSFFNLDTKENEKKIKP